ncbi:type IV pilus biogenesis protein PilP [Marinobacterium sp. BA1]|uniref:type IV pilus biogenesis protein PilP n=1 Tax=Marinobacterium sp. BA1 TaxID=3138931 RepID=UPI0032E64794
MQSKKSFIAKVPMVWVAVAAFSGYVYGDSTASNPDSSSSLTAGKIGEEIRRMNEEMVINGTRIRKLEQKRELLMIESEVEALENQRSPISVPEESVENGAWGGNERDEDAVLNPEPIMEVQTPEPIFHKPVILEILGSGGTLYATLIEGSGRRITVKEGDTIENGWKVVSIHVGSVNISRGGEEIALKFGQNANEFF